MMLFSSLTCLSVSVFEAVLSARAMSSKVGGSSACGAGGFGAFLSGLVVVDIVVAHGTGWILLKWSKSDMA